LALLQFRHQQQQFSKVWESLVSAATICMATYWMSLKPTILPMLQGGFPFE
jgi:hypothetical protein